MSKMDDYRRVLRELLDLDTYLLDNSGLPGPRGNIELGLAAAEEASPEQIRAWLDWDAQRAPTNTREEFLAFCGVLGLGRLAVEHDEAAVAALRRHAGDERWRTREAVAMAVQRIGDADFDRALAVVSDWIDDGWLACRSVAAGLCEPRLLTSPRRTAAVLDLLDKITEMLEAADDDVRRDPHYRILRQGLGYCWSVAVASDPIGGPERMERWIGVDDADIRWVMRSNLAKKRLERMNPSWVESQRAQLGASGQDPIGTD
jgi:hypothetical protein